MSVVPSLWIGRPCTRGSAGRRGVDQLVQRDAVDPGQRQQQLQGRPAPAGLQPGQRAHRDAGRLDDLGERRAPLAAQRAQPGAHVLSARRRRSCGQFAIPATDDCHPGAIGRTVVAMDETLRRGGHRRRRGRAERERSTLSRARRSVLVVDAGEPRNAPRRARAQLPRPGGHPAGRAATRIGRSEVERLRRRRSGPAGWCRSGAETTASVVALDGGAACGRGGCCVAAGLTDDLPDLPGRGRALGAATVLHCPYCHGWEVRDRAVGIVGTGPLGAYAALLWRQWTDDVVLLRAHRRASRPTSDLEKLAARGRPDRARARWPASRAARTSGWPTASWSPGTRWSWRPRFVANAELLADLGAMPVPMEMHGAVMGTYLPADPTGRTDVPGVWVAGNAGDLSAQVIVAAAQGLEGRRDDQRRPRRGGHRPRGGREAERGGMSEHQHGTGTGRPGSPRSPGTPTTSSTARRRRCGPAGPTGSWSPRPPTCRRAPRWTPGPVRAATPSGSPPAAGGSPPSTSRRSRWGEAPPRRPSCCSPTGSSGGTRTSRPGRRPRRPSTWSPRTTCTRPGPTARRCSGGWPPRSRPAGRCSWSGTSTASSGATGTRTPTRPARSTRPRTSRRCSTRREWTDVVTETRDRDPERPPDGQPGAGHRAGRAAAPGRRQERGRPSAARASVTASSCSRSSASSRCSEHAAPGQPQVGGAQPGQRRARAGERRPAGRAGRRAAGRRRPRGRPTPTRRAARPAAAPWAAAPARGGRRRPAGPSRRQLRSSVSRSARPASSASRSGEQDDLGEQVAEVAHPALVGRPAGRGDDRLGQLLGRRPVRRAGRRTSRRSGPAARRGAGWRRTRRRRPGPRRRAPARGAPAARRPPSATVRRQAANGALTGHLRPPTARRRRWPPPGSSIRPPGRPARSACGRAARRSPRMAVTG